MVANILTGPVYFIVLGTQNKLYYRMYNHMIPIYKWGTFLISFLLKKKP